MNSIWSPPVFTYRSLRTLGFFIAILGGVGTRHLPANGGDVNFNRDIRPLLAKHCFTCHGPDEAAREADLRLDVFDSATADLGGYQAIQPGDAAASELITRITSDDSDARMPPPGAGPPLDSVAIEKFKRWINQGAEFEQHWSFVPPRKASVPDVPSPEWCEGVIDRFTLRRMNDAGLEPTEPANRADLARRLYLDLTGLPPTPDQVDRFVANSSPTATRRLVDELLASPDYGPHAAAAWLDLARYADTNGYEKDRPRTMWPYRDWVINSLNEDKPFDQFSIEQLAGDMLPNPTQEHLIATGFHRNTMLNEEGGIDPLEYRYYAMIDRVGTTGTVWMGLTVGCAQCHTHKYDPIKHDDFYSLYSLLNQADEPEVPLVDETLRARQAELELKISEHEDVIIHRYFAKDPNVHADNVIQRDFDRWFAQQRGLASQWTVLRPDSMSASTPKLNLLDDGSILAQGDTTKREVYELTFPPTLAGTEYTALRLEALPHHSLPAGGPGMAFYEGRRGDFFLSELSVHADDESVALCDASHSFGKISVGSGSAAASGVLDRNGSTGWSTATQENRANRLVVNFERPFASSTPWTVRLLFERHFAASLGHFRVSATTRPETPVVASEHVADVEQELVNEQLTSEAHRNHSAFTAVVAKMRRHYVRTAVRLQNERKPIEILEQSLPELTQALVFREREPGDYRPTFRHHRGEYLQPKEPVEPGIPEVFAAPDQPSPRNRLELAQWLVSDGNPLVTRVAANRAWRHFWGNGLVRTSGDYGTQSEPPTHPELLDWLAVELSANGWSMKRLHRQMVLSATYQQRVAAPPATDPSNRLLAVHPYRRLQAEQIRDAMLAASGTLVREQAGPGVYPPQPSGVYELAYGGGSWPSSTGADRFRRSIYTFRKRTAPFAAFSVFDAPTGETCLARRDQSTTPLQSLTLLNDEMYMELAREAAGAALRDGGPEDRDIVSNLFRRFLTRVPTDDEISSITQFTNDMATQTDSAEQRWTLVARAILNLDEVISIP